MASEGGNTVQNYELSIDPVLAREAQSVFQELGTNLPAAVAVFLRRTVNRHAFPFPAEKSEFTDEELAEAHRRGMEQIQAGQCVRVSMADLEKMDSSASGHYDDEK